MQYSIIKLSEQEPISLRLDAEYYQTDFLQIEKKIKHKSWDFLEYLSESIKSFGAYSLCNQIEYKETGIPFLRCKDIKSGLIDFSKVLYIDEEANKLLWKSEVHPKTVLLTMSGTVGNSAIAKEDMEYPINSNQDIAKIITNDRLNPYYLSVFIESHFGKNQIKRLPIGSVQQHIFLWQLEKLTVPVLKKLFQDKIETIFKLSLVYKKQSSDVYKQAQTLLLSELGLLNWQPKRRLSFVKNYSDINQAGRIDADYFQPFYEEIDKKLQSIGLVFIKDICSKINYGSVPTSPYVEKGTGTPYIKGLNLKNNQVVTEKLDYIINTEKLPEKVYTKEGDVIISQMGTVGNCGVVTKKQENWIFASFTIRIRIKDKLKYIPHYVAFYIETIAKPYYLMRNIAQASVRQNTDLPTIKNMPIPDLSVTKQTQIQQKLTEAFNLRKQSKHLFECAKRTVEIAIEQNEDKAIKWLKKQTEGWEGIDV